MNARPTATKTRELHTGLSGNGSTAFLVVTLNSIGGWHFVETFATKAEAISWIKYA